MKRRIFQQQSALGFALVLILGAAAPSAAFAFTVTIDPGSKALYLRVGDGVHNGYFDNGGTVGSGAAIGLVSVAVPGDRLGNRTPMPMTGNSDGASHYDGYAFCNSGEVYIGGFYRKQGKKIKTAVLTVTTPRTLTNSAGDTVPINRISWTTQGKGDTGSQPIPAGSFSGGVQTLASFPSNRWQESCFVFSYENTDFLPPGDYTARATYTLSAP